MEIPKEFKLTHKQIIQNLVMCTQLNYNDMWYNRFSEYLFKKGCVNNLICSYIFNKKSNIIFVIIVVIVNLILIRTLEKLTKTTRYLKNEFDNKDFEKTKFCHNL